MAWIEPKTDWTNEDYFNIGDYNRIIGNLSVLKDDMAILFKSMTLNSSTSTKSYTSMIYASEINSIATDVANINSNSYNLSIGTKKTYKANGNTPMFSDLNRIESAMYRLHQMMQSHKESLNRLSFNLTSERRIF